jgi:aminoglycoside phosphotransferase (APT) family kinase protein
LDRIADDTSTPLSPAAAAEVLALACPGVRVDEIRPGPSGYSSKLWLAETDEGPLLVRFPQRNRDPRALRSMVLAARLANQAGVPTVRYRGFAPDSPHGPAIIQEFRRGERASDVLKREPDRLGLVSETIGDWLGRIHGVHAERFGGLLSERQDVDWHAAATEKVRHALAPLAPDQLPASAATIRQAFADAIARTPLEQPASLVHGDLYFDNVLLDRGKAVCLLDFEHAAYLDRFCEFGKLNELLFEWWTGSEEPLLAAYRDLQPPAPGDAERRWLGVGLYELAQLAYFARWQADLVPVYRARLDGWLTASGRTQRTKMPPEAMRA